MLSERIRLMYSTKNQKVEVSDTTMAGKDMLPVNKTV